MPVTVRAATLEDIPALNRLIGDSARQLCRNDYSEPQIEAALKSAWGVDSELICDGTYFVVEDDHEVLGCGGWSRRMTLFGGDNQPDRQSTPLDPGKDAARIRAFFVSPNAARRGIATLLLKKCEAEAVAQGFRQFQLIATLPGTRFYSTQGYIGGESVEYLLRGNITIGFVPMKKSI